MQENFNSSDFEVIKVRTQIPGVILVSQSKKKDQKPLILKDF